MINEIEINGVVYEIQDKNIDDAVRGIDATKIAEWDNKSEFSGNYADLTGTPTKLSEFINDTGFVDETVNNLTNYYLKSETLTKTEINTLVGSISTLHIEVVSSLPTTDIKENTIYFVPTTQTSTNDIYDEYIYTNNNWEKIGNTQIDLSGYALKSEIPTLTSQLTNDSGFLTGYTETDPTVPEYVKSITEEDIANWNASGGSGGITVLNDEIVEITTLEAGIYLTSSDVDNITREGNSVIQTSNFGSMFIFVTETFSNVKKIFILGAGQSTTTKTGQLYCYVKGASRSTSFMVDLDDVATNTNVKSQYLSKTNTTEYTPTEDYHPATKLYVDTATSGLASTEYVDTAITNAISSAITTALESEY